MKKTLFVLVLALLVIGGGTAAAETPQMGGSLIVILGSDPEHLNPGITTSYPTGALGASIFSSLIWRDGDGMPQPEVASSWEVSEDNLTYTFYLRDDVFWHDGEKLTSADVKFSMEEILAENHGRFASAYAYMESISTPDDYTVVIQLEQPYAPLINLLTVFDAPILPKHVFEGGNPLDHPANQEPVGSGAFKFVEWSRGDRIVLERFDDYFEGPAYMDQVIYRIVPQDASRAVAMEVGEADLLWGFYLPAPDLDRLSRDPELEVWQGIRIPSLYFVFMNTLREGLSDARVRQAIMFAVDRDQIVEQALQGLGTIDGGPFGIGFPMAFNEETSYSKLYPHNPERARELLDEAGVEDLTLTLVYDAVRQPFAVAAEIIRDNLRNVGITLTLQPVERSVMLDLTYARGEYDFSMQSFTSGGDPAIGYHRIYATAAPGTPFVNATGYSNPVVDELLMKAGSVSDFAERQAIYDEIAAILAADVPVLVMFDELSTEINHKDLRGLRTALDSRDRLQEVWWAR